MTRSIPLHWDNIISASLEGHNVPGYLEMLNTVLVPEYLPTARHVQTVLYLSLNPPKGGFPPHTPPPLNILQKIIALYPANQVLPLMPTFPRGKTGAEIEALDKQMKAWLGKVREEGIWGGLWQSPLGQKRKRAEEEDEDDEKGHNVVRDSGWEVLDVLLTLWEKDQKAYSETHEGVPYSPSFLLQLPKHNQQYDNPAFSLAVIKDAFFPSAESPARSLIEKRRWHDIASRLFTILVNTALAIQPPFHPTTLLLSLLPLFTRPPISALAVAYTALQRRLPPRAWSYILSHVIEDLAGVRIERSAQRRRGASGSGAGGDFEGGEGAFGWVTVPYLAKVLTLPAIPEGNDRDIGDKMGFWKSSLMSLMATHRSRVKGWEEVFLSTSGWKDEVEGSIQGDNAGLHREIIAAQVEYIQRARRRPQNGLQ